MDVHIIDGHAVLAVPDVVRAEHVGDVFGAMTKMVMDGTLLVTRSVTEVTRRRDPNGAAGVWADTIVGLDKHVRVEWSWQEAAQQAAFEAGYEEGLEDTVARRSAGTLEVVALLLARLDHSQSQLQLEGHVDHPVVVTEDWSDKPLRPALGPFCTEQGWATCRLAAFLCNAAGLPGIWLA